VFEYPETCDLCTLVEQAGRRYCLSCGLSEESPLASRNRNLPLLSDVSAMLIPVAKRVAGWWDRQGATQHQR